MKKQPILKNYVSETDQFLESYTKEHPSASFTQQQEIAKHRKIHALRDTTAHPENTKTTPPWENF